MEGAPKPMEEGKERAGVPANNSVRIEMIDVGSL
jgi:hypothetical protein